MEVNNLNVKNPPFLNVQTRYQPNVNKKLASQVIPNNTVYQLGASCHALDMHCKRYSSVTCKGVHVLLSKTQWTNLMNLATSCINRGKTTGSR